MTGFTLWRLVQGNRQLGDRQRRSNRGSCSHLTDRLSVHRYSAPLFPLLAENDLSKETRTIPIVYETCFLDLAAARIDSHSTLEQISHVSLPSHSGLSTWESRSQVVDHLSSPETQMTEASLHKHNLMRESILNERALLEVSQSSEIQNCIAGTIPSDAYVTIAEHDIMTGKYGRREEAQVARRSGVPRRHGNDPPLPNTGTSQPRFSIFASNIVVNLIAEAPKCSIKQRSESG